MIQYLCSISSNSSQYLSSCCNGTFVAAPTPAVEVAKLNRYSRRVTLASLSTCGCPRPSYALAVLSSCQTSYRGLHRGGRAGWATSIAKAFPQTFPVLLACRGAHLWWLPVCRRLGSSVSCSFSLCFVFLPSSCPTSKSPTSLELPHSALLS